MKKVTFEALETYMINMLMAAGVPEQDAKTTAAIYIWTSKRGMGHHDIHNFPSRIERIESTMINPKAHITKISSFAGLESWDGDNGLGEVLNDFSMKRAMALASEHGIGLCAVRRTNHYLCSAPYTLMAAKEGYIGFIMAKAQPSMGMPGCKGYVIGRAPVGYSFPMENPDPVILDMCLANIAGEPLIKMAKEGKKLPVDYYGVDKDGNYTDDPMAILKGTVYAMGGHKGFGLAILEELLTGVLSEGAILDQEAEDPIYHGSSHTAIAIKADALMPMDKFRERSQELVNRLYAIDSHVRMPGDASWKQIHKHDEQGYIELEDEFLETCNKYAEKYHVEKIAL